MAHADVVLNSQVDVGPGHSRFGPTVGAGPGLFPHIRSPENVRIVAATNAAPAAEMAPNIPARLTAIWKKMSRFLLPFIGSHPRWRLFFFAFILLFLATLPGPNLENGEIIARRIGNR